jgi:hypothetical protein
VTKESEGMVGSLTEHTFALCDGSNCTDMGPVAAGTKCVDGAITWDTRAWERDRRGCEKCDAAETDVAKGRARARTAVTKETQEASR